MWLFTEILDKARNNTRLFHRRKTLLRVTLPPTLKFAYRPTLILRPMHLPGICCSFQFFCPLLSRARTSLFDIFIKREVLLQKPSPTHNFTIITTLNRLTSYANFVQKAVPSVSLTNTYLYFTFNTLTCMYMKL